MVKREPGAPRMIDLTVRSPAMGRDAKVRLMTPVGWTPDKQWPVLYLLHGCCDTYDSWARSTQIDRMKPLRKVLVVMPEGGDVGFYADWKGGPGWETFHTKELPALLEEGFGAGDEQAIAGLSMGGLGAIGYAARHPGEYAAAASFSGLLHPAADKETLSGLMRSYDGDPATIYPDGWEKHDPTELAAKLKGTRLFVSSGNGHAGPFESDRRQVRLHRGVRRGRVARLRRPREEARDPGEGRLLRAGHPRLAVLGARAAARAADAPRSQLAHSRLPHRSHGGRRRWPHVSHRHSALVRPALPPRPRARGSACGSAPPCSPCSPCRPCSCCGA